LAGSVLIWAFFLDALGWVIENGDLSGFFSQGKG
jgi:hypothetical protein